MDFFTQPFIFFFVGSNNKYNEGFSQISDHKSPIRPHPNIWLQQINQTKVIHKSQMIYSLRILNIAIFATTTLISMQRYLIQFCLFSPYDANYPHKIFHDSMVEMNRLSIS